MGTLAAAAQVVGIASSVFGIGQSLFGGGAKQPRAFTPPALPPAAKPFPTLTDAQQASAAARKRQRFRSALGGRGSTDLTGGLEEASFAPKTLLGQ